MCKVLDVFSPAIKVLRMQTMASHGFKKVVESPNSHDYTPLSVKKCIYIY